MFGWLTGKTGAAALDRVASGVDDFFFTDEEKAAAKKAIYEAQVEMAKATAPQNMSRRIIAVAVTGLWAFFLLLAVGLYRFDPEFSKFIFETMKENVNTHFSIIMAFYFGAHLLAKFAKK